MRFLQFFKTDLGIWDFYFCQKCGDVKLGASSVADLGIRELASPLNRRDYGGSANDSPY